MTVLYRNSSGKDVTHASYSSRQTFNHCPREFQLTRIDGWSDKEQRAATLFGRCIESGLQAYEENDRKEGHGVRVFKKLWEDVKLTPGFEKLVYTASEGSWEQLLKSGEQMMRLYEVRSTSLPITRPIFQQKLRKKIFPGTNLDVLENVAVLDILSHPRWDHPMLAKLPEWEQQAREAVTRPDHYRELIIDVKTSGKDLAVDLVALDPQLAEYAWQTRIPDVAFLWFVKRSHKLEKGSRISLLRDHKANGAFWAGWEGFVVETGEPDAEGRMWCYLGTYDTLQKYEAAVKGLRSKARDAATAKFLDEGRADGSIVAVSDLDVTKQRIQFAAARFTEQDMNETGRSVAQTTVQMVRAAEENFYPKVPGVRFPNEKCNFCAMRWICLHRPEERDSLLTRRGEEWLDGLQEEDNG